MPPVPKTSDGGDAGATGTIGEPLQIISMDKEGSKFDLNIGNLKAILNTKAVAGLPAVVVSLAGASSSRPAPPPPAIFFTQLTSASFSAYHCGDAEYWWYLSRCALSLAVGRRCGTAVYLGHMARDRWGHEVGEISVYAHICPHSRPMPPAQPRRR